MFPKHADHCTASLVLCNCVLKIIDNNNNDDDDNPKLGQRCSRQKKRGARNILVKYLPARAEEEEEEKREKEGREQIVVLA